MAHAYVYDHVRTPRGRGRPDGARHEVTPIQLATPVLSGLPARNGLDTRLIDDVILGTAMPSGEQPTADVRDGPVAGDASARIARQVNQSNDGLHSQTDRWRPGEKCGLGAF